MSHRFTRQLSQWVAGPGLRERCFAVLLIGLMFLPARVCSRPLERTPVLPVDDAETLGKSAAASAVVYSIRLHYVGSIWATVTNYGIFGTESGSDAVDDRDKKAVGIDYNPSLEFPAGTRADYLFKGGYWFGGIVGNDTLVSMAIDGGSIQLDELHSFTPITESSSLRNSPFYDKNASANQQYYARFSDTMLGTAVDPVEGRRHHPLDLDVSQTSYAWPDSFAQQFVIVELWIRNISDRVGSPPRPHAISDFVLGVFMDYDIFNKLSAGTTGTTEDDISGFLASDTNLLCGAARDPLNVAWAADNDGDPKSGRFPLTSTHGIVGVRFLVAPPTKGMSFNWWTLQDPEWGPAKVASGDPVGIPNGDRRAYYLIANRTTDYGQVYSGIDYSSEGWRKPPAGACGIADGLDTRQIIAVGPLEDDLLPGDSIRIAFALLAGNNFHTDPFQEFNCKDPDAFLAKKSFKELSFAAQWASWIYDTPGYDTDHDGYAGEYHDCNCKHIVKPDTIYDTCYDRIPYVGDMGPPPGTEPTAIRYKGAPDLVGPSSPPGPDPSVDTASGRLTAELTAQTRPGQVILRWDGRTSETTKDNLSRRYDFEGYRVYAARQNVSDQYSLVASWDREDYKRYVYDNNKGQWVTNGQVLTVDDIRRMTGDSQFDPKRYSRPSNESCYKDTVLNDRGSRVERCSYFAPQGDNLGDTLYVTDITPSGDTVVQKIPNMIQRVEVVDTVILGDSLQYGRYEMVLNGMPPSLGQYFSVTVFDAGDQALGLPPLESPRGASNAWAVPIYSADVVRDSALKVIVFPNPYKVSYRGSDGRMTSYFEQGYEAPEKDGGKSGIQLSEADRRINFINLPDTATIKIYTLDGDLVRTIQHPDKILSGYSSMASWDLVSRNAQAVVSGIYLYRVDSPHMPSQVGKIVIIK